MRIRSKDRDGEGGGAYFAAPKSKHRFIGTGCGLLDLVVGGGWPLGRMANIIGDKSTGKTLLAIEACANFLKKYPNGKIWYREAEAAFDQDYAHALGMPVNRISFLPDDADFDTVEAFFEDLDAILKAAKPGQPGLYILDSLDSLSSKAEMERKIDAASYGDGKAKLMSQLFRRLIRQIKKTDICVIIISQIRDNIGAMFGDKTTRSGGRALDFYASQTVKLAHIKQIVATSHGSKRVTGVRIKAKCTKNKIGLAHRECEFIIRFAYGIESYEAGMEWLIEVKQTKVLGLSAAAAERELEESVDWDAATYAAKGLELDQAVAKVWREIDEALLPTRRKYA